ncbi:MAG: hypothetical protein JNK05_10420 [Myxococcales bacterium]|nr:hypothetical protein [Myxococcales bacterium]
MFPRKIAMALLLVGAVSGYASGFRSMAHRREMHRRAAVEQFSRACAEAAVDAHRAQSAKVSEAASR